MTDRELRGNGNDDWKQHVLLLDSVLRDKSGQLLQSSAPALGLCFAVKAANGSRS